MDYRSSFTLTNKERAAKTELSKKGQFKYTFEGMKAIETFEKRAF